MLLYVKIANNGLSIKRESVRIQQIKELRDVPLDFKGGSRKFL